MWYGGNNKDGYGQRIGYATSRDGINWNKSGANPVLPAGNPGDWDANTASFASVLYDNGILKMWYTGKNVDPPPVNSYNYYWDIGYATDPAKSITDTNNISDIFFTLSPNPFTSGTTIHTNKNLTKATVAVYNSSGQQVISISGVSGSIIKLQRNNLPVGWYLIRVIQYGKPIITGKFVITN
jgi:hypothetical protein